jgi:hypothetical protein
MIYNRRNRSHNGHVNLMPYGKGLRNPGRMRTFHNAA